MIGLAIIALYLYVGLGCMAFVVLWFFRKAQRPLIGWLITSLYIMGTYAYIMGY